MDGIFETILTLLPIAVIMGIRIVAAKAKKASEDKRSVTSKSGEPEGFLARFFQQAEEAAKQQDPRSYSAQSRPSPVKRTETEEVFSAHRLSVDEDSSDWASSYRTRESDAQKSKLEALRKKAQAFEQERKREEKAALAAAQSSLSRPLEENAADEESAANRTAAHLKTDIKSSSELAVEGQRSLSQKLAGLSPLAQGVVMAEILGQPLAFRDQY